ncbi:Fe-S metabolism associated SufE [Malaciobacter mytili]|uniref:Fe-S metabolism associated SufE n=2 Tax=Malaciobacter mytili TaxID=603050 RepID=A0AAX2AG77_9BACT|nr:Fe-S metabolism associated SufE [Malaciobacter mytili]RXK16027.1 Fe-S metabolism associated SufE [Malaciobacter mytili LMG 24559]
MKMIESRIDSIKDDLELFDDDLQKYEYIIDLGKSLPNLEEEHKKDENLVQGCTSKVWLICEKKDDILVFKADSNAAIVKGLVKIILTIFNNLSAKEILDFDTQILQKLNLQEIITPNRQSGVQGMIKRIKEYAKAFA